MKVGWIGLGRLGLPCALVLADRGHEVVGFDVVEAVGNAVELADPIKLPYVEPGVEDLLKRAAVGAIEFRVETSIREVVRASEVVFVAVQTPHAPEYDGTKPVPEQTRDFEYGYLIQAVREVARAARDLNREIVLVVVSTVLPGTINRLIRPLLNTRVALVYSPQFIAMGTTIRDFTNPEFLLLGTEHPEAAANVADVFDPVHAAAPVLCTIADAEMAKVAYNTFISMKIAWANHLGALCDATGADADRVVDVLAQATQRVASPAYLRPGMGDGGACHPRDLIAMAGLELRAGLPLFFGGLAQLRDQQTAALAELVLRWADQTKLDVCLLGLAYKPGVPLMDGSPALLLKHYLGPPSAGRSIEASDPGGPRNAPTLTRKKVYVISTNHPQYHHLRFPSGSVVIDPWGDVEIEPGSGVVLVRPGRR